MKKRKKDSVNPSIFYLCIVLSKKNFTYALCFGTSIYLLLLQQVGSFGSMKLTFITFIMAFICLFYGNGVFIFYLGDCFGFTVIGFLIVLAEI